MPKILKFETRSEREARVTREIVEAMSEAFSEEQKRAIADELNNEPDPNVEVEINNEN